MAENRDDRQILLDNIRTQVWYLLDEHTYGAVNRAHADFFGRAVNDLSFQDMYDLFPKDVVEVCREENREVFLSGKPLQTEEWVVRKDGEQRLLSIYKSPKLREDGSVEYVVCSAEDITERTAVQRKLHQQKEKYRNVVDNAQSVILRMDLSGHITFVNPFTLQFFGYTEGELLGHNIVGTIVPHADSEGSDLGGLIEKITADPEKYYTRENENIKKNGERVWVSWTNAPLRNDLGEVTEILSIGIDMTRQKQTVQALEEATEHARDLAVRAEKANAAKSEFLANMSHEIRTPLNGVIGFTELLLATELSETQRQYLANVESSAGALMSLINDILDFSKIEAGKLELDFSPVNVRELLEQSADIILFKADEKGLEFLLDIDPAIRGYVTADQVRLRQVIANLLSNAVKFTETGEVELAARIQDTADGPVFITFSVRDTGIGMSGEQRKIVFNAFTQADSATTRKFGGTGLGLAISKELVEKMGGTLSLTSSEGEGSVFSFTLNCQRVGGSLGEDTSAAPPAPALRKVLIIDDNRRTGEILQEMFSFWGVETLAELEGHAGLRRLREARPVDAVILDYHMPGMDGLETARCIRNGEIPGCETLPLILLYSPSDDENVTRRCAELDIQYKIKKPVKMNMLREVLEQIYFPGAHGPDPEQPSAEEEKTVASMEAALTGRRILIAEDNDVNMFLAKSIIKKVMPDAEILEAENGNEAVLLYRKSPPDIILMDVQMPGVDGYKATGTIRELEEGGTVHTPIIALTASALKGDREKCLEAGMDDYLAKPVTKNDFTACISRWLQTGKENSRRGVR